jgi:hypothetical protein
MGLDKNTIRTSEIDTDINILKELNHPYILTELGKIQGRGINDLYSEADEDEYPIRKLEYGNIIILEQIERHTDCDMDDIIRSFKFNKVNEPSEWQIETTIEDIEISEPYSELNKSGGK